MIATRAAQPRTPRRKRRIATRPASGMALFTFPTRLGWMALAAAGDIVCGLTFGHDHAPSAIRSLNRILLDLPLRTSRLDGGPGPIRSLVDCLRAFAQGEATEFLDVRLDCAHLTPFGVKVTECCRHIPWGTTSSYRELAEASGRPGAARAVGNVMRNNRYPLIVPCHRVLAWDGSLGGYSAPQGLVMKQKLLHLEGRL